MLLSNYICPQCAKIFVNYHPLKSACHCEVRYFLYSLVNELAIGVSSAPSAVNFLEVVMHALRAEILKDVIEIEIMNARIEREPMKYLVIIRD